MIVLILAKGETPFIQPNQAAHFKSLIVLGGLKENNKKIDHLFLSPPQCAFFLF
jgi:hypothetical protein